MGKNTYKSPQTGREQTQNTLIIKGEKKEEKEKKETKDKEHYHVGHSYGSFQRSIPVPCEIESDKVDASFKKGILKVTFPKSVKVLENLRKIEVKSL